jgi:glycosyltransferase involved in cell wall biosynthesis
LSHTFDIIVPTYNNLTGLKACLESIRAQTFQDFKVWVCVDGSTDGTIAFLEKYCSTHSQFAFIEHSDKKNHGRSQNRNLALSAITAPYLLMIDGDAHCTKDLLLSHLSVLKLNKNNVSLGHTFWANKNENLWANYISKRGVAKHRDLDTVPYQYFTTQNVAMPRAFFTENKGLDPYFVTYGGEDTELAYRMKEKFNATFIFNKNASIHTESDKSIDQALDLLETFGHKNLKYIAQKHPNCTEIFYLKHLKSNRLSSILFRLVTNKLAYSFCYNCAKVLPFSLTEQFINICVAYRIKKGFQKN